MKTLAPSTTQTTQPPRRTAPFNQEPGFYEPARLWLYGNSRLLNSRLVSIEQAHGLETHSDRILSDIEGMAAQCVLAGKTIVTGVHSIAHKRVAVVPLRWGAPRIVVVYGGFFAHLGDDLREEPFRAARLWRYEFDPGSDLVISRQEPRAHKSSKTHLPTVDRLIQSIVTKQVPGLLFE